MTRKRWLILVGVVGAVALYLFWNPRSEIFLVPQGYVGPVVVAFAHPRGTKRERTINAYVYRIPRDGILRLKDIMPDGFKIVAWFYEDGQGHRTRIPELFPEQDRHKLTTPHLCCEEFGGKEVRGAGMVDYIQASIGVPSDDNAFYPAVHFTTEEVLGEYATAATR